MYSIDNIYITNEIWLGIISTLNEVYIVFPINPKFAYEYIWIGWPEILLKFPHSIYSLVELFMI